AAGGIAGTITGNITNAYSKGDIQGTGSLESTTGGIAGTITGNISNACSEGVITGYLYTGGIAGLANSNSSISNTYSTGSVDSELDAGGIVGKLTNGTITDSYSSGHITSVRRYAGGVAGIMTGDIRNVCSSGNITGSHAGGIVGEIEGNIANAHSTGIISSASYAGGIAGKITGDITNSYSTNGVTSQTGGAGGIAAWAKGNITNAYSLGNIKGKGSATGGIAGEITGNISNTYSKGSVEGEYTQAGGIAGKITGNISNAYSEGAITAYTNAGGIAGYIEGDITNAYSTGNISSSVLDNGGWSGGIAGVAKGNITNVYSTGNIYTNAGSYAGGIVAKITEGTISNAFSTGFIGGYYSGGIAGLTENAVIKNVYATGNLGGSTNGGIVCDVTGTLELSNYAFKHQEGLNSDGIGSAAGATVTGANLIAFKDAEWFENSANIKGILNADITGASPWGFDAVPGTSIELNNSMYVQGASAMTEAEAIEAGYTVVKTAKELQVALEANQNVMLFGNIDMSEFASWSGIQTTYTSTFDGNGFTISNLTGTKGLFTNIDGASIKNVDLENVNIQSAYTKDQDICVGAVACNAWNSTIENIGITGHVESTGYASGVIGDFLGGTITNVNFKGEIVSTSADASGIVGKVSSESIIKDIQFEGKVLSAQNSSGIVGSANSKATIQNTIVNATIKAENSAGGIVANTSNDTTIEGAYFNGDVENTGSGGTGGIIGAAAYSTTIREAHATGSVKGANNVGGFAGTTANSGLITIENSSACMNVEGVNYVGGFAGSLCYAAVSNSYFEGNVTGTKYVGGFAGVLAGSSEITNSYTNLMTGGVVSGNANVGGFVGEFGYDSKIDGVVSKSTVIATGSGATNLGGFAGITTDNYTLTNYAYLEQTNEGVRNFDGIGSSNDEAVDYSKGVNWFNNVTEMDAILNAGLEEGAKVWNFSGAETVSDSEDVFAGAIGGAGVSGLSKAEAIAQGFTVVETARELQDAINANKKIMLFENIDLSSIANWSVSGTYANQFEGNGKTISGLTGGSLLGTIGTGASVSNLIITNANVTTGTGAIADSAENASFRNISVSGSVTGVNNVGGLVGYVTGSDFAKITSEVNVSGSSNVGGIVGHSESSDFSEVNVSGTIQASTGIAGGVAGNMSGDRVKFATISATISGAGTLGSVAGRANDTSIENIHVTSSANITASGGLIGGIVGTTSGTMNFSEILMEGTISGGSDCVGGIVGEATILNANKIKITGSITSTGNNIGGIAGSAQTVNINDVAIEGAITGKDYTGGIAGNISESGTISNITITGKVAGKEHTGGVAGSATKVDFANIKVVNKITGENYSGGIAGYMQDGKIEFAIVKTTILDADDNANYDCFGGAVGKFTSTLNDEGETITFAKSVSINATVIGKNNIGGFAGLIEKQGTANLNIDTIQISKGKTVSGENYVAALVGEIQDTSTGKLTITNISSNTTVTGKDYTAGIIGKYKSTAGGTIEIQDSYSTGNITGKAYTAGIIGSMTNGTITNTYSTGNIKGENNVGGIAGYADGISEIQNSYSTGNIKGVDNVGGILGNATVAVQVTGVTNSITLTNVSSSGKIEGNDYVAGIIGAANYQTTNLTNVYSSSEISGANKVGGIAGYIGGNITNALYEGTIKATGDMVGGILGGALDVGYGRVINNVTARGNIETTGTMAGGIAGYISGYTIENAISGANVKGGSFVGGFVGYAGEFETTIIKNSYVTGLEGDTVKVSGGDNVGGFVGQMQKGAVENSGADAEVIGNNYVGGFVGSAISATQEGASIANSYATGSVTGNSNVGGFAGSLAGAKVTNSFAGYLKEKNQTDFTVTGNSNVGGFAGFATSSNITYSFSEGTIKAGEDIGATSAFGGFIGAIGANSIAGIPTSIANVYSTAKLSDNITTGARGGFIGEVQANAVLEVTNYAFVQQAVTGVQGTYGIAQIASSASVAGKLLAAEKDKDWFNNSANVGSILNAGIEESKDIVWNMHVTSNGMLSEKLTECVGVNAVTENEAIVAGFTVVRNAQELQEALTGADGYKQNIMLFGDIDLSDLSQIDQVWNSISSYSGIFDGNGFKISNINEALFNELTTRTETVTENGIEVTKTYSAEIRNLTLENVNISIDSDSNNIGVIANSATGAIIKNVTLNDSIITITNSYGNVSDVGTIVGSAENTTFEDINISGAINHYSESGYCLNVGFVAGSANNSTFANIELSGTIDAKHGEHIGSLVGQASGITVNNVSSNAEIIGNARLGGIIGQLGESSTNETKLTAVAFNGNISCTTCTSGGIVGIISSSENSKNILIEKSYSNCTINGNTETGGIVGKIENTGGTITIKECFALGNIMGDGYIGGIVGYMNNTAIDSCWSSADVSLRNGYGTNIGGLVGYAGNSTITNSCNMGNVSGSENIGGLVGKASNTTISNSNVTYIEKENDTKGLSITGNAYVGGFIGYAENNTIITNSFVKYEPLETDSKHTLNISGTNSVGGFAGYLNNSAISNSYSSGTVSGTGGYYGGFAGIAVDSRIENVFSTTQVETNGAYRAGGFIGAVTSPSKLDNYHFISQKNPDVQSTHGIGSGVENITGIEGIGGAEAKAVKDANWFTQTENIASVLKVGDTENVWDFNVSGNPVGEIGNAASEIVGINGITEAEAKAQDFTVVKSALELQNALKNGENVMLFADIDMNDLVGDWETIKSYTGTLDGNGFTISNVNKALFDELTTKTKTVVENGDEVEKTYIGTVQNLNLENVNLTTSINVDTDAIIDASAIANSANGAIFDNINIEGNINGGSYSQIGFIAGTAVNSTFNDIAINGSISGEAELGLVAGQTTGTNKFTNITLAGSVTGSSVSVGGVAGNADTFIAENIKSSANISGDNFAGGIVGYVEANSTINNCEITGNVAGCNDVGGIAGSFTGEINNCAVTGNVAGNNDIGGIVGMLYGTISNSYTTGNVTGVNSVGGIAGNTNGGNINDCFATGTIEGYTFTGGITGSLSGNLSNSYFAGTINTGSGIEYVGGLVGVHLSGTITNCVFREQANNKNLNLAQNANGIGFGTNTDISTDRTYESANFVKSADWFTNKDNLESIIGENWNFNTIQNADVASKYSELVGVNLITEAEAIAQGYTVVKTANELQKALENGDNAMLFADIDINDLADGWATIASYTGTFDGNGFTISNLTGSQGLFETLTGTVQNLKLENVNIKLVVQEGITEYDTGAVAGKVSGGKVSNVTVTGTIDGTGASGYTGAITGRLSSGEITNCAYQFGVELIDSEADKTKPESWKATGSIKGEYTGGIVGAIGGGTISGCKIEAGIQSFKTTDDNGNIIENSVEYIGKISGTTVGGIAGYAIDGKIVGSSVNANINIDEHSSGTAGGVVGYINDMSVNGITIVGCTSSGSVSGTCAGGVVVMATGERKTTISDCFSTATVTGDHAGGFAGVVNGTLIENSYAAGNVTGTINAGGFIGKLTNCSTVKNSYCAGNVYNNNSEGAYGGFIGYIETAAMEFAAVNIHNVVSRSQVKATAGACGAFIGNIAEGSYVSLNTEARYAAGKAGNYAYALQENTDLNDGIGIGIKTGVDGTTVHFMNTKNNAVLSYTVAQKDASWFQETKGLNTILNGTGTVDAEGNEITLEGDDAHWKFGYEVYTEVTETNENGIKETKKVYKTLALENPVLTGNVTGNASLTAAEVVAVYDNLNMGSKKSHSTIFEGQVLPDGEADNTVRIDTSFDLKIKVDVDGDGDYDGKFGEDITIDILSSNDIAKIKEENLAILNSLKKAIDTKQQYIDDEKAKLLDKEKRLEKLLTGGASSSSSSTGAMKKTHSTSNINKQEFNNAVSDLVQALMEVIQGSLLSGKNSNSDFYNIMNLMGFPTNLLSGSSTGLSGSSWSGGSGLSSK
ncbi:hypothetical protein IKA15_00535, partial [bacterium]|nr:hypothetical protein [bacterium]